MFREWYSFLNDCLLVSIISCFRWGRPAVSLIYNLNQVCFDCDWHLLKRSYIKVCVCVCYCWHDFHLLLLSFIHLSVPCYLIVICCCLLIVIIIYTSKCALLASVICCHWYSFVVACVLLLSWFAFISCLSVIYYLYAHLSVPCYWVSVVVTDSHLSLACLLVLIIMYMYN